jgi:hypothetical protein
MNNIEHSAFIEMKQRLHAGETIIVLYNNPDNDNFSIEWEFNILKLIPTGEGKYDRYWRKEDNSGWIDPDSDYDRGAQIEKMNPFVHVLIFNTEQEAIDYIESIWKKSEV